MLDEDMQMNILLRRIKNHGEVSRANPKFKVRTTC